MRARSGFSLVELLVVVAIIGVLVGILLPAVQAAREAARQTQCRNNLRQIGIALHAYHGIHAALPTGCVEWRGPQSPSSHRQLAWSAWLLPFLEEQAVFAQIDFALPFDHPANELAAAARIATFECPTAPRKNLRRGPTDYGGLFGEVLRDPRPDDGIFLHDRAIRFRQISDGLSQTLAVAEDVGGPDAEWINGRNVFVQSGSINDPQAWVGDNEIRSLHPGGAMGLFGDAHVSVLVTQMARPVVGAIITRAGKEVVPAEEL